MPRLRCVLLWSDVSCRTKAQDQLEDIRQENKSNRESSRLSECLCQLYFKNYTDHDIHDRYDIQKKKPAIFCIFMRTIKKLLTATNTDVSKFCLYIR